MRIAHPLNRFLDWAAANRLWCLAGAAFVAIFWFLASFGLSLPSRLGEVATNSIRFDMHAREGDKVLILYDAIKEGVSAYLTSSKYYTDHVAGYPTREPLPPVVITEGFRAATEARNRISIALGTIQGTSFEDARLQGYRTAFQDDIAQIGGMAARLQDFFLLQALGKREETLRTMAELNSLEITQHAVAMLARAKGFNDTALLVQREHSADIDEQFAKLRIFNLQLWAALGGLIYEIAFVVVAAWTIWVRPPAALKMRAKGRK